MIKVNRSVRGYVLPRVCREPAVDLFNNLPNGSAIHTCAVKFRTCPHLTRVSRSLSASCCLLGGSARTLSINRSSRFAAIFLLLFAISQPFSASEDYSIVKDFFIRPKTLLSAIDDEVMDWVTEALHQSHADQRRFRDEAIAQLRAEHSKIRNRLDKLYEDRLDGFIEPAFFERKAQEWRHAQKRLTDQI